MFLKEYKKMGITVDDFKNCIININDVCQSCGIGCRNESKKHNKR